ncbi:HrpR [Pseudomonas amygdali pv. photiniae]|uniref:HrpR n=1 Tax=Pseudomonas amygdali pv. photiniae TaxID=251724 RepID=A0A658K019_PSEA0|nr:HrpR [Pseudomonas amygdali pv. photiniae]
MQILLSHDWPGNVRELKSAAKRFVLGFPLLGGEPMDARDPVTGLRMQMRVIEKMLIQDALKRHRHNVDAVLQELELPRRTLYHRMKELGVAA